MPSDEGMGKHSDHIIQAEPKICQLWTSVAKVVIRPANGVCMCVFVERE